MAEVIQNCDTLPGELEEHAYFRKGSVDSSDYTYMGKLPAQNTVKTDTSQEGDDYTYMAHLPVENEREEQAEEYTCMKRQSEDSNCDDMDYNSLYIGRPQGDNSNEMIYNHSYSGRNNRQDDTTIAGDYDYTREHLGKDNSTDDMDYNSCYTGRQLNDNMNYYSYPEAPPVEGLENTHYYSYPEGNTLGNSDIMISTTQNSAYNNRAIISRTNESHFGPGHNNDNSGAHFYEPAPRRGLPPLPQENSMPQPPVFWQPHPHNGEMVSMSAPNMLQPVSVQVQKPPPVDDQGICPTIFAVVALIISILFTCWVGLLCSIPAIILASTASTWSANGQLERARKYRQWSFCCSFTTVGFTVVAWIGFAAFLVGIICGDGTC